MGIEQQLTAKLKEAMLAKQADVVSVIRMVKTMATKEKTSSGFSGETDDAFWLEVIGKYVKQQKKALAEFEKLGEVGADQIASIRFELEYLEPFLPKLLEEDAVTVLVEEAIISTGAQGPKMIGKVIGAVMKGHKDQIDPAMVKRIAGKKLG